MKKCILIYDDDPEILAVCKVILGKKGYKVETYTACDMIIEDVQLVKPDLVFLDLWIPKMGGEMATMLVKNNKETQSIPIILFSALDDIETIQKRIKADGFLKKPFDINEIIRLVENKLAGVD